MIKILATILTIQNIGMAYHPTPATVQAVHYYESHTTVLQFNSNLYGWLPDGTCHTGY